MNKRCSTALDDRRGVASIEFILVMPVLLVCLTGVVEVTQLYRAQGKVYAASNMMAKMLAQQTSVSKSSMQNFCYGVQMSLAPLQGSGFSAAIASVTNSSGTPQMDWEYDQACATAAQPLGAVQAIALANGTLPPGQWANSVLVVSGSYAYTSPFHFFLTSKTLTYTSEPIPRSNNTVACTNC